MPEQTIKNFLDKYNLLSAQTKILVGLSGGADSLCLTYVLYKLSLERHFKLYAIHINHQWRGEESLEDETFVKNVCNELNIPIFIERLDPNLPKTELIAREKRYEIFNKIANENNIKCLFTAHTQSDQVETILYRIIKGTGTIGLTGIPEIRLQNNGPAIYRPMLSTTRTEVETYLYAKNLIHRTDSSNLDEGYLRNRIRHSLLPELKTYNNQVENALLKLSKVSVENESIIEAFIKEKYNSIFEDKFAIKTNEFNFLPEYIKPRILIKLFNNLNLEYDYSLIERLLNFLDSTIPTYSVKKISLVKDFYLSIDIKHIKVIKKASTELINSSYKIKVPGITEFKELNLLLKITEYKNDNNKIIYPLTESDTALVDLSKITEDLNLRTRRDGDIINPLGMKGHMKLKKYLINKHIPQPIKDLLPVIAYKNEILWLVGIGLSDKIKVSKIPTHIFEIIRG